MQEAPNIPRREGPNKNSRTFSKCRISCYDDSGGSEPKQRKQFQGFRKQYKHRRHRMKKAVAKVAGVRKLAVRLFWMLRTNTAYPEIARIESSSRDAVVGRN